MGKNCSILHRTERSRELNLNMVGRWEYNQVRFVGTSCVDLFGVVVVLRRTGGGIFNVSMRMLIVKEIYQTESQHLNKNTRPQDFSGHEFTGPML